MAKLPESFLDRMKGYLGDEFDAFVASYDLAPTKGIRVNELKCTPEKLISLMPVKLTASPFCKDSFYSEEEIKVGFNPLHSAGAFYSQEPSASVPVELLDPKPGDFVLDMCAAPGGKTTQIASKLQGEGLIICNEVVRNRANILLSNVERMGIANAVVTSSYPEKFADALPEFFDKIVVDAPCSGEGMFRKNAEAITEWSPEHVASCATRQLAILDDAAVCLKKGGTLVYSTCTFSYDENEGVITEFLNRHPDFELVPVYADYAHSGLDNMPVVRIYPMDGGEGHFAAKLRKLGEDDMPYKTNSKQKSDKVDLISELTNKSWNNVSVVKDKIYLLPDNLPNLRGISVLRSGVLFGETIKNRIEPHHHFFMASKKEDLKNVVDLDINSDELLKFLRGEEIEADAKGYTAVCVNGITIGFGKASNGRLKNKYPKGLRYH